MVFSIHDSRFTIHDLMNLFVKIFLWFLAAIALMVGVVIFLTQATQTEPVVSRWQISVKNQTDVYAETAAQILQNEGEAGLRSFLERIRQTDFVSDIGFAERSGKILYFGQTTEIPADIVNRAFAGGETELDFNSPNAGYTAKKFTLRDGGEFVLVTRWERPPMPPVFGEAGYRYMRLAGLLLTAFLVCFVFARYLSAPIVKLSAAAKNFADGNLQTRVSDDVGRRHDEIGRLARDFDEMAERIGALIDSQKRLSRDVSHELRSPLARLNVALELAKQKSNAETINLLDRIEREGKRLNEMIAQILTLSKLESGSEIIEKRRINLTKLLERVVADADFEAENQNKKVEIVTTMTAEISGNDNLVRSAIENVLRNAVRYSETKTEVSLEKKSDRIIVKIRDDGQGVPDSELANLFTPFYRVGEARERKSGGVGLGLAIAEQAVQTHHGRIFAANSTGGGLEIQIIFPAFSPDNN